MAKATITQAEFDLNLPMPDRARVTIEISPDELKQLFTLAAMNGMPELSFALGRAANPLQANLNRLQNDWKDARKERLALQSAG